jgi:hypothetical protein
MMRYFLMLLSACIVLTLNTPVVAQTQQHETPAVTATDPHAGHGADPAAPSADVAKPTATDSQAGKHMQMMQGHTQKMREQMAKIRAAQNPKERQKLMQEHMTAMREGMKMLKDAPGCAMTGAMAMAAKGTGQGMMDMGNMMMCHQMMEKKVEMMQGMLEGLMESSQTKK